MKSHCSGHAFMVLSNKGKRSQKISLKEEEELITDDAEVANVLNKHFVCSVRCLDDVLSELKKLDHTTGLNI